MKPPEYRNRRPLEYLPNDIRLSLKSRRHYSRDFIIRRRRRKLPGIPVGVAGIVIIAAGELIQGVFGMVLFFIGVTAVTVGLHFELLNKVVYEFKYVIAPALFLILFLGYIIRPQMFAPILPKQHVTLLAHYSSGFPFDSTAVTVTFGGGDRVATTYTEKELKQEKNDSLSGSRTQVPLEVYLDKGKLFIDTDVFAGPDRSPILIRANVVSGLPYGWDGNYNNRAFEIVTADTIPVFQLVYLAKNRIRVNGVFQVEGGLVIADESGVTSAQGKRVLFYGTRPIFKYPSWKFPHQLK